MAAHPYITSQSVHTSLHLPQTHPYTSPQRNLTPKPHFYSPIPLEPIHFIPYRFYAPIHNLRAFIHPYTSHRHTNTHHPTKSYPYNPFLLSHPTQNPYISSHTYSETITHTYLPRRLSPPHPLPGLPTKLPNHTTTPSTIALPCQHLHILTSRPSTFTCPPHRCSSTLPAITYTWSLILGIYTCWPIQ